MAFQLTYNVFTYVCTMQICVFCVYGPTFRKSTTDTPIRLIKTKKVQTFETSKVQKIYDKKREIER